MAEITIIEGLVGIVGLNSLSMPIAAFFIRKWISASEAHASAALEKIQEHEVAIVKAIGDLNTTILHRRLVCGAEFVSREEFNTLRDTVMMLRNQGASSGLPFGGQ